MLQGKIRKHYSESRQGFREGDGRVKFEWWSRGSEKAVSISQHLPHRICLKILFCCCWVFFFCLFFVSCKISFHTGSASLNTVVQAIILLNSSPTHKNNTSNQHTEHKTQAPPLRKFSSYFKIFLKAVARDHPGHLQKRSNKIPSVNIKASRIRDSMQCR